MKNLDIVIVGAGINGLVAANYLQRAGCRVTVIERAAKVGGACISADANIDGVTQSYALGASVLGLMQDFVFEETGLAAKLQTFVPEHPKLLYFPGDNRPTWIYRNSAELDKELANKWGERGQVEAFRTDEAKVVEFLQDGYVNAIPPTIEDAISVLGKTLTRLWISGSANELLNHYFTSERSKLYAAMRVTESGPVSLSDPYSAFTHPLLNSGSIFGGFYGFVKGGIWQVTEQLGAINAELGVSTHLSATVTEVDTTAGNLAFEQEGRAKQVPFDFLVLGTDPMTAAKLVGSDDQVNRTARNEYRGSSGKLNLMFRNPVQWKHGTDASDSDAAFRYIFSVNSLAEFEKATISVRDDSVDYDPGYMEIYCEGAAMRLLGHKEPFDRLAVFFKNLSLNQRGESLLEVENQVKKKLFEYISNPEDCAWTRLLTPKDLQQLFLFPGGNIDHSVLVGGQTFFDRNYSDNAKNDFYRFGNLENVYLCGAGTYPCGSVAGTPGYMCSQQLLRRVAV